MLDFQIFVRTAHLKSVCGNVFVFPKKPYTGGVKTSLKGPPFSTQKCFFSSFWTDFFFSFQKAASTEAPLMCPRVFFASLFQERRYKWQIQLTFKSISVLSVYRVKRLRVQHLGYKRVLGFKGEKCRKR